MPKTVINSYVAMLIDGVRKAGVEIQVLLEGMPFQLAELQSPNYRIPMRDMTRLWQRAIALTQDPHLGLHIGSQAQLGTFNALAPLLMNCPTIEQVITFLPQFTPVVSESGEFSVVRDRVGCHVRFTPNLLEPALTHHQIECIFASMVTLAKQITDNNEFPVRVEFQHERLAGLEEYQKIFGCEVIFRGKHNELLLSDEQLKIAIRFADPSQLEHHTELLSRRLRTLKNKETLAERVLEQFSSLPVTDWLPERMADVLGISLRSLQRYLHKEGTSYQALLDHYRKEQSKKLLLGSALSVTEIAERLGYLNISSYHRAFQRWYGVTPGDFRVGKG